MKSGHLARMDDAPRLAVLDCDGTLVDSLHTIVESMTEAWRAYGLADPDLARVRWVIGLPLEEAIANLAPDQPSSLHAELADGYRQAFAKIHARPDHHEPLYPGARAAIEALRQAGVVLGIATGKGSNGLRVTLARHDLERHFATVQTSDRARGKPHPEMLLNAMAEVGAAPRHTVMIGDTVHDVEMAVNANVASVGVSWGYHDSDSLRSAGAAAVIDEFAALPAAFDMLTGATARAD